MAEQLEIKEIISLDASPFEKTLLLTLFETGRTLKEIVNLRIRDYNNSLHFDSQKISLTKDLQQAIEDLLAKHPFGNRNDAFLFYSRESLSMSTRRVEQIIAKLGEQLGTHLTPRKIRHISIIKRVQAGEDIQKIEKITGLKSIQRHIYLYHKQLHENSTLVKEVSQ